MTSYADEQIADAKRRRAYAEVKIDAPRISAYGRLSAPISTLPDSGKRAEFDSGMVRDVEEGKVKYDLALDGPMFERWATHMTAGAEKYEERNWMLASGPAEFERFRRSALRHFIQWFHGNDTEDHAAAVFFNINGAEYVTDRMVEQVKGSPTCATMEWRPPVKAEPATYMTPNDRFQQLNAEWPDGGPKT